MGSEVESSPASSAPPFAFIDGAYVVVGGFGNLGFAIAQELVERGPIKLVLIARTPLPDRAYWDDWLTAHDDDDAISQRIRMVRTLEARGSEVLALSADVCQIDAMTRRWPGAAQLVRACVVHAAASSGDADSLQTLSGQRRDARGARALCSRCCAAKNRILRDDRTR